MLPAKSLNNKGILSVFIFPFLSEMSVTSDEVNYLIYRYLQESGTFFFTWTRSIQYTE